MINERQLAVPEQSIRSDVAEVTLKVSYPRTDSLASTEELASMVFVAGSGRVATAFFGASHAQVNKATMMVSIQWCIRSLGLVVDLNLC